MNPQQLRSTLIWEATKAAKAGLLDASALASLRALVKEKGPDADIRIQGFAQAFFAKLGTPFLGSSPLSLPQSQDQSPQAPPRQPQGLLRLPREILQIIFGCLDPVSRLSLLFTSYELGNLLLPHAHITRLVLQGFAREPCPAPLRAGLEGLLPELLPTVPRLSARLFLVQSEGESMVDLACSLLLLPRLHALQLQLEVFLLSAPENECVPNSALNVPFVASCLERPGVFALSFIDSAAPTPLHLRRSRLRLKALKGVRSVETLCEFIPAIRLTSKKVSLRSHAPDCSGTVDITTAAPRVAKFFGQALFGDASAFLMDEGALADGQHGLGTLDARGKQEIVSYQRQRYKVGEDMFESGTQGFKLLVPARLLFMHSVLGL